LAARVDYAWAGIQALHAAEKLVTCFGRWLTQSACFANKAQTIVMLVQ
jgi:hypothetical protein